MLRQNIGDGDYLDWFYNKLISILEDELRELFTQFNKTDILRFEEWNFIEIRYRPATKGQSAYIHCVFQILTEMDFEYNSIFTQPLTR